jgi:hypothetical protein
MPIGGDGNCFFTSVVTLLALVRNQDGKQHNLDETELRRRVIEWLRNCGGQTADVCKDCMLHMQAELNHSVTCLCLNKWVSRKPQNIADYLDMSSQDGVWVAGRTPAIHHRYHHIPQAYTTTIAHPNTPLVVTGYHWPIAVATLFKVCLVVVIHGHDHMHCFGDPAHPRIHLYNKDSLTHFDALLPAPVSGDDAISPEKIVIEETSSDDNNVRLVPPPHPYQGQLQFKSVGQN